MPDPATNITLCNNADQNLYGIAADSSGFYVSGTTGAFRALDTDPQDGAVGKIPLTGGAATTLYSGSLGN